MTASIGKNYHQKQKGAKVIKLAVIGATGIVGNKVLELLDEKNLHYDTILTAASENSVGKYQKIGQKNYQIISMEEALGRNPDIAIFCAGSEVSKHWAPKFSQQGCYVIDNSSFWRMNKDVKLIVPEINAITLTKKDKIIANPNCSTIPLTLVLNPLHKKYKVKRIIISTYQAVSGAGKRGIDQLLMEQHTKSSSLSSRSHTKSSKYIKGDDNELHLIHPIHMNVIPHIDSFLDNGYTKEEMKIINETKKILNDDTIQISVTAVRVPILNSHSASVNIEFESTYNRERYKIIKILKKSLFFNCKSRRSCAEPQFCNGLNIEDIKSIFNNSEGVKIEDEPQNLKYPMPITSTGQDLVYVGRIREDLDKKSCVNLWISSDNIRKGAATNALQIAEYIKNTFFNIA